MRSVTAVLLSLVFSIHAGAASIEEDVQRYAAIFKDDKSEHSASGESLGWMGLSDTRLFDIIEQRLLQDAAPRPQRQDYATHRGDTPERQRLAWYIRALGFSGQAKYLPTINKFLENRDYAVYSRNALKDLPVYQTWNPVISNRASFQPAMSDEANRAANMLRDGDFMLKRLGAKRIFYDGLYPDPLLDLLAEQLRANYPKADAANGDALAWMVRALGSSRKEKYKPLIEQVRAESRPSGLQDHARRALELFYTKH
jgi:hypothetical protein